MVGLLFHEAVTRIKYGKCSRCGKEALLYEPYLYCLSCTQAFNSYQRYQLPVV